MRYPWRFILLMVLLSLALAGVFWRLIDLGVFERAFLLRQSKARILRVVKIPAYRGVITDRLGKPLAVSTPVASIWVNPKSFQASTSQLAQLAQLLKQSPKRLRQRISTAKHREFVYLKRRIPPELAVTILQLGIKGVFQQREYRRYYPDGEVSAHIVGLTNVDDQGQEGLELAYNSWLQGRSGKKEVLKDRMGNIIADIALLKQPQQGHNLILSVDHRLQYLAYHGLKAAMNQYQAASGSVVVLNIKTGEVLAMVNQPSYNPNSRPKQHDGRYRNRAVTDIFEPGSTIKPFNIALALQSGKYTVDSTIDTNPGWMWVGGYKIKDDGLNYGVINLKKILQKSSNIGAAKIMLSLQPQAYWGLLRHLGFGQRTQSGFPGEVTGSLVSRQTWQPSVVATLAYGYGIAVTALQLAHAYAILADSGLDVPVSFVKVSDPSVGRRVLRPEVADEVVKILESVVKKGGTGTRARIKNYRVAGKTGTAYIATKNGYDKRRYTASFVGMAPASHPQLAVAVIIRDPKHHHFGGIVAAPLFAKVMAGALRFLGIPPDDLDE
jgi:cell division protein FtsI (penicillin-binding protein 3)